MRLDKNERIDDLPNKFIETFKQRLCSYHFTMYPDLELLYSKLALFLGCQRENLLLIAGADGGIKACYEAYSRPSLTGVILDPTFAMVEVYGASFDCPILRINDDASLLKQLRDIDYQSVSFVLIASPNSPTGKTIAFEELKVLSDLALKYEKPLFVDEAYFGFHSVSVIDICLDNPWVICCRSFSKAWGLAGLRVGCLIASSARIAELKSRAPMYEINSLGALALEILLDNPSIPTRYAEEVNAGKQLLLNFFDERSFQTIDGNGNFIHVKFETAASAAKVRASLLQSNYLISAQNHYLGASWLRFSVGSAAAMADLTSVLSRILES